MTNSVFCPITNLKKYDFAGNLDTVFYEIRPNGGPIQITFCQRCYSAMLNDPYFNENKHIVAGLMLNKKLRDKTIHWEPSEISEFDLKKLVQEKQYELIPEEIIKNLLIKIGEHTTHAGKSITMIGDQSYPIWYKYYFKNPQEQAFYLNTLSNGGFIDLETYTYQDNHIAYQFKLTYNGLVEAARVKQDGLSSNFCFIAMSFGQESNPIREAIKKACIHTNHHSILIDETHYDSHQTINDAIIAQLKKSKFCIADFTEQKDGVYFESGFALGQGKKSFIHVIKIGLKNRISTPTISLTLFMRRQKN